MFCCSCQKYMCDFYAGTVSAKLFSPRNSGKKCGLKSLVERSSASGTMTSYMVYFLLTFSCHISQHIIYIYIYSIRAFIFYFFKFFFGREGWPRGRVGHITERGHRLLSHMVSQESVSGFSLDVYTRIHTYEHIYHIFHFKVFWGREGGWTWGRMGYICGRIIQCYQLMNQSITLTRLTSAHPHLVVPFGNY